ncbi:hypothetical protein [Actinoplanes awajinensis]|uniref:Uncharacterized protein n=1 Tax=Actinoplanes awajinensis subsp. mycoplanecinus TaxID=135947 RepID=A0A101JJ53_9ACTN|nr:hypothetical protein [Actinoplanes awajinensis]KUL27779.1 hypothetical protein ADL15_33610 [Actinoplanes awajinensis subsp. mycoplanecinus]
MTDIEHPQATVTVLGEGAALPDGSAGILVDVRETSRKEFAAQIGVDGEPAIYGFGRALIPVAPGRHVVEAQKLGGQEGSFALTVRAGEVARLVYERLIFRTEDTPPARRRLRCCGSLRAWRSGW